MNLDIARFPGSVPSSDYATVFDMDEYEEVAISSRDVGELLERLASSDPNRNAVLLATAFCYVCDAFGFSRAKGQGILIEAHKLALFLRAKVAE